jgi:fatty acid desaturase
MFIDGRTERFYYNFAIVADRCLFVLLLLFLIGLFYLSVPVALLVIVGGIVYYVYTEWLEEQRREAYAFYDRARYDATRG